MKNLFLLTFATLFCFNVNPVLAGVPDNDGDGVPNNEDCAPNDPDMSIQYKWYADVDGDGYGDGGDVTTTCEDPVAPLGYVDNQDDCDDADASWAFSTHYADLDDDGFGDATNTRESCDDPNTPKNGFVVDSSDCDDNDATIFPGAVEVCDSIDNNCNGTVDEGFDVDSDGIADCVDTEECDGVDNDGDGEIDEGVQNTYFEDADGDSHGNPGSTELACEPSVGFVATSNDCDDSDADISPTAEDVCENGIDENCDGQDAVCPVGDNDGDGFDDATGEPVDGSSDTNGSVNGDSAGTGSTDTGSTGSSSSDPTTDGGTTPTGGSSAVGGSGCSLSTTGQFNAWASMIMGMFGLGLIISMRKRF